VLGQYLTHIWIVSILSLSAFIKLYYLYKALLLCAMFIFYSSLSLLVNIPWSRDIFFLLMFVLLVLYHGRQVPKQYLYSSG
jgi:hypothetical protein